MGKSFETNDLLAFLLSLAAIKEPEERKHYAEKFIKTSNNYEDLLQTLFQNGFISIAGIGTERNKFHGR